MRIRRAAGRAISLNFRRSAEGSTNAFSGGVKHRSLIVAILMAVAALASENAVSVRGSVVTLDADGSRTVIPAAVVTIEGAGFFRTMTVDNDGSFQFRDVVAGQYRIRASAPGLTGSASIDVRAGESVDVPVVMEVEALRESLTINGNQEVAIAAEPEQKAEIKKARLRELPCVKVGRALRFDLQTAHDRNR